MLHAALGAVQQLRIPSSWISRANLSASKAGVSKVHAFMSVGRLKATLYRSSTTKSHPLAGLRTVPRQPRDSQTAQPTRQPAPRLSAITPSATSSTIRYRSAIAHPHSAGRRAKPLRKAVKAAAAAKASPQQRKASSGKPAPKPRGKAKPSSATRQRKVSRKSARSNGAGVSSPTETGSDAEPAARNGNGAKPIVSSRICDAEVADDEEPDEATTVEGISTQKKGGRKRRRRGEAADSSTKTRQRPASSRRLLATALTVESLTSFAKFVETDPDFSVDLQKLQRVVGRVFKRPDLLRYALIQGKHAPVTLSWVGDSLLYFLITEHLSCSYPAASPGALHTARQRLITRAACATRAREFGLDSFTIFSASIRGQPYFDSYQAGNNVAGELFEAILGAVYLDGGVTAARKFFKRCYKLPSAIEDIKAD